MNLNDFVVIPNKPKSVKLNARNLRELHMETVTLAQESKDMEDRLQQLRESMSREKEERERSGGFRWKSGQAGAVNNHSAKRNKESGLQKLSAGKVKIRLLKDQPQPEVCRVGEKDKALAALSGGQVSSRKTRLRGKVCGQCEARTAGLMCAECGEDYCVGCFAKFHQKGALKLHRMIPIQTEIQTSVSTLDVVSRFQRQVQVQPNRNPNPKPKPDSQTAGRGGGARGPERRTQAALAVTYTHNAQGSQVLVVNPSREEEEEFDKLDDEGEKEMLTPSLLGGEYDEEASAHSFQEALKQWRREGGERREGRERREGGEGGERAQRGERGDAIWRPCQARPVSMEVMGTQVDLSDSGAERGPVKVEFTQHSLSYMDRLLIKRHRRMPIEAYQPLSCLASTHTHTLEDESTHTLTAEDVELRRYCASLFAVSFWAGSAETDPSPGSCLSIEELDEAIGDRGLVTEQTVGDRGLVTEQTVGDRGLVTEQTVGDRGLVTEQKAEDRGLVTEQTVGDRGLVTEQTVGDRGLVTEQTVGDRGLVTEQKAEDRGLVTEQTVGDRGLVTEQKAEDRGLVTEQKAEDNTKQEETNVIGGPNLSHNALSQGSMLSGSPVTRSTRPPLVSKARTTQIPQPDHTTVQTPRSTTGSPQARGPKTPRSSTKTPAKSTRTDRSYILHNSTLNPSFPSHSPSTPNPDLLSARPPCSLSPSPPSLHSLRSTFTLSPSSPTEPESPPSAKVPRASRFIYPPSLPKHLPDRCSPPKPLSLRSQSSLSPSEPLSSTLPYSQSPRKQLSIRSESTKSPLNPLSTVSPGSQVSYRSSPKPLSTMSPSTPSCSDVLSSRNVSTPSREELLYARSQNPPCTGYESTPSPEDSVSPLSSPHSLTARLSYRYVSSPSQEEHLPTRPHSYTEAQSPMSSHPSPPPSLMSDPLHLPLTQSPPHSSDSLRNNISQQTPRLLSGSGIRKSHSPALFSRMPATDFDMESSSDSLGLTPREEDSSDEEMKMDGCLEEWKGRVEDRCSTSLSPTLLPEDPEPETGVLFPEPSMALRLLAQREQTQAGSFCGLEGFLILGVGDLGSPQPGPSPTHSHPDTQDSAHNLTTGRSTPRLSSRPKSAVSRHGTMSHPVSRPLSRAAQEILDICLVDQTGCEDPDLEQDVDTHALSSLAEEFRLMATDSDLPQVSPSVGGGAETEGRVRRRGSLWLGASEGHSDEEEESLRDQQNVLSLP